MSKNRSAPHYVTQIRQVLTADTDGADWPEDLLWARGVLGGAAEPPPESIDKEVLITLMDELLRRGDTKALTDLAKVKHKRVSKAARTALHRLRTQKVKVEVPTQGERAPSGTGQSHSRKLRSLATIYDPRGEREVALVEEEHTGITMVQARLSASQGLVDIRVLPSLTRKKYRQMVKRLDSMGVLALISREQARWYIEDGVRRGREAGRALPGGYARACQVLGPTPSGDHPALDLQPGEADPGDLLALYQLQQLSGWLPDRDFLNSFLLKLQEIYTSKVIIDDNQRRAQLDNAIDQALESYFTAQNTLAARQILLDTVHMLRCQEQHGPARAMRAAADLFQLPRERLLVHPFIRMFLERMLQVERAPQHSESPQDLAEERQEGGVILTGDSSASAPDDEGTESGLILPPGVK